MYIPIPMEIQIEKLKKIGRCRNSLQFPLSPLSVSSSIIILKKKKKYKTIYIVTHY